MAQEEYNSPMDNNQNNSARHMAFINKNKNILILIVAILAVVAIALMVRSAGTSKKEAPIEEAPVEVLTESPDGAAKSASTFDATYASYEGKRFTISGECLMNPGTLEVAKGTTIMVYNTSKSPRTVVVGDASYAVGLNKYRTIKLAQAGTIAIGCDGLADAATAIVK